LAGVTTGAWRSASVAARRQQREALILAELAVYVSVALVKSLGLGTGRRLLAV